MVQITHDPVVAEHASEVAAVLAEPRLSDPETTSRLSNVNRKPRAIADPAAVSELQPWWNFMCSYDDVTSGEAMTEDLLPIRKSVGVTRRGVR